ncbi:hypothetical protein HNQ35_001411 [Cerasibacillus quisquiliarum]|uniref:Phospholipase A2 domain-containing protein n=1 Tax=Cerasibacillus quisquiliarum TaxID=227865 RepID=A0A511UWI0_9BACI|nr:hypothetical protein [Cerasibacillus quisquiliarum]MBB5146210.1 hypothetical protein [Cerasibacillus quisquiliarum]GEN30944.1 hypothetical protein CQU01_11820 [Cerasibacillus quisquiliarum]
MGVFERALEGKDLDLLVQEFMRRPDFNKAINQVKEDRRINPSKFVESKGFEVITKVDSEQEEVTIQELTLYLKYEDDVLIRMTQLKAESADQKERSFFSVNVEVKKDADNQKVIEKFSIDDGEFTFSDTFEVGEVDTFAIPTYLEVPHDSDDVSIMASPVPCFNWDGSGTCCKFRYNGLPWNPLVTYKWCGANCGNGCGSTPTPVNALDRCCKSHDCCYVNNKSYPARCSCDRTLINCARGTDNAGSDRVVVAFQAKMLAFRC